MVKFSRSNSLPCFALSDFMLRLVRLPDSQGKDLCPLYALKGLGVLCCSGSDGREKKKKDFVTLGKKTSLQKTLLLQITH